MATRTYKVYNGDTVIKEGASPNVITGLSGSTKYNLKISAVENGDESVKVDVPEFTTQAPTVAVTGVTIAPKTASINVGATQQLTPTVAPSNATNKAVTYTTSDATKATVNASGLVTGVAVGSATITVKTTDGNKTDTSVITVTSAS